LSFDCRQRHLDFFCLFRIVFLLYVRVGLREQVLLRVPGGRRRHGCFERALVLAMGPVVKPRRVNEVQITRDLQAGVGFRLRLRPSNFEALHSTREQYLAVDIDFALLDH
jgi:hypothetical protein